MDCMDALVRGLGTCVGRLHSGEQRTRACGYLLFTSAAVSVLGFWVCYCIDQLVRGLKPKGVCIRIVHSQSRKITLHTPCCAHPRQGSPHAHHLPRGVSVPRRLCGHYLRRVGARRRRRRRRQRLPVGRRTAHRGRRSRTTVGGAVRGAGGGRHRRRCGSIEWAARAWWRAVAAGKVGWSGMGGDEVAWRMGLRGSG